MLSTVTTAARPPQDTVLFSAKAPSASTYTLELTTHGPVWMIFRLRVLFGGELAPTWGFYDLKTPRRFCLHPRMLKKTSPPPSLSRTSSRTDLGFLDLKMPRHSPSPPRMLEKTSPPPSSSRTSSRTDSVPRPEDALTSPPPLRLLKKTSPPPSLSRTSSSHLLARYLRMPTCPPRIWERLSQPPSLARTRPSVTPDAAIFFFFADAERSPPNAEGVRKCTSRLRAPPAVPSTRRRRGTVQRTQVPPSARIFTITAPAPAPYDVPLPLPPAPAAPPGSLGAPLSSSTTAGSVGDSAFGAPVTNSAKIDFFLPMPDAPLSSFSTGGDDENAVGVHTTLVAFTLTSLPTGFSRTVNLIPLHFHHLPAHPPPVYELLDHSPARSTSSVPPPHHLRPSHEHCRRRAAQPFAREGPGSCYNVACAKNTDIKLYRRRVITGSQLLERLVWKVGHTNDIERRQGEYGSRILIVLSERFAQLQQLCDGGNLVIEPCPGCKRRHREYYDFRSVGGFKQFTALMNKVITTMGEVPSSVSTLHLLVNLSAHLGLHLGIGPLLFFGIFFAQAVRSVRAPPRPPARSGVMKSAGIA
ncbi:hypothetical protein B0H11DRAFT_1924839, partial [Mycena galericulata]